MKGDLIEDLCAAWYWYWVRNGGWWGCTTNTINERTNFWIGCWKYLECFAKTDEIIYLPPAKSIMPGDRSDDTYDLFYER